MSTTEPAYIRLFAGDKRAVTQIAQAEGRTFAAQAAIIFGLGVKAYQAKQEEARKAHV